ncbi:SMI1/KNR4 family protein [Aureivirga sp. CE67]|uniref:SMI1/KNR4 family protein n=1 Tax=Aureivirga sp. CE67 TaxID=1788983 RepID=UPI0018C91012|nr:SMI1/KNR4 family protein [Aureivirga sp. CE67]
MKIILEKQKISIEELQEFEASIKEKLNLPYDIVLPIAYKRLILNYNGGVPEEENEAFLGEYMIDCFYSIKYGNNEIVKYLKYLGNTPFPKNAIPIGASPSSTIYMELNGTLMGGVIGLMYDNGDLEELADSFEEFVEDLEEYSG